MRIKRRRFKHWRICASKCIRNDIAIEKRIREVNTIEYEISRTDKSNER
jgi:hypothetical protein